MDKVALLVIDMQIGNFEGENPIYNGQILLENIKLLILKARNAKTPIIYVQNDGGKGDPDEKGTRGWQIHPLIKPNKRDIIIEKNTPDSFYNTNLQEVLNVRNITKLVIGGLQTEFCVDTTCRRAYSLGYRIILVQDGHSTWNSAILSAQEIISHHNDILGSFFVSLKMQQEIFF
jgi:nicotinamidase-related amidase